MTSNPAADIAGDEFHAAVVLCGQNRHQEALPILRKVADERPDDATVCETLGQVLAHVGFIDQALAVYRDLLDREPGRKSAIESIIGLESPRVMALLANGRLDVARAWAQELLALAPDSFAATMLHVRIAQAEGRNEAAIGVLRRLLDLDPGNANAAVSIANVLMEMGRKDEALAELDGFVERSPDSITALLTLGQVQAHLGKHHAAAVTFRKVLAISPDDQLAKVSLRQLHIDPAMRAAPAAAGSPMPIPEIIRHLQQSLAEFYQPERFRDAVRRLELHCQQHPQDVEALLSLADAYSLGAIGGAHAWRRIQSLLTTEARPDAARQTLERAYAADPSNQEVIEKLRLSRLMATPSILVAALPRSGSVYLFRSLIDGLNKPPTGAVMAGVFPDCALCQKGLLDMVALRAGAHTHLAPSRMNLIEIGARMSLDRMLVHVRDPRQAAVSWFHFMPAIVRDIEPSQALHLDLPGDYFEWPQDRQLDWQIDHWFRWAVDWISGWIDAAAQPWFKTRILYTRFEDMVLDQKGFFGSILDFYDIDRALFTMPEKPTIRGDRNFRQGEIDEWRRVFTARQIERVSSMIPDALFERFGWPRA